MKIYRISTDQQQLVGLVRRVKSIILAAINRVKTKPYENPDMVLNTAGIHAAGIYNALTERYSGKSDDPNLHAAIDQEIAKTRSLNSQTVQQVPSTDGWIHFIINGDCKKETTREKAYISVDPKTFTGEAFISSANGLAQSGFQGQLKLIAAGMHMTKRFDNIVIHACDTQGRDAAQSTMQSALQSAGIRLGGEGSTTQSTDAYGTSGNNFIAQQAATAWMQIATSPQVTSWDHMYRNVEHYFNENNGPFLQYITQSFANA